MALKRLDIQCLRAFAVGIVILDHFGVRGFEGGFIGVDIFFVISGYLISGIILSGISRGHFSFGDFYLNRAKRILPALLFVLSVSFLFSMFLTPPPEIIKYSKSTISALFMSSNIYFWRSINYFNPSEAENPLLHTWSLGVEEQFYLIFPIFAFTVFKLRRKVTITFISLLFGILISFWLSKFSSIAAFFLTPSRVFEFFFGVLAAVFPLKYERQSFLKYSIFIRPILWLVLISQLVLIDETTSIPLPGLFTTLIATSALLKLGEAGRAYHSKSSVFYRPFVFLGDISYSLYLWHQPFIAFGIQAGFFQASVSKVVPMTLALIGVSFLTWKYIETPYRKVLKSNRRFLSSILIIVTAITVMSGVQISSGGYLLRENLKPKIENLQIDLSPNVGLSEKCDSKALNFDDCLLGKNIKYIFWGDSYAMHLVDAFIVSNPKDGIFQATLSSCTPVFDLEISDSFGRFLNSRECKEFNDKVREFLSFQEYLSATVVISTPFVQFVEKGRKYKLSDTLVSASDAEIRFQSSIKEVESLGYKVVIVSPPPTNDSDLGKCVLRKATLHQAVKDCDYRKSDWFKIRGNAIRFIKRVENNGANVIWLDSLLCKKYCVATMDGVALYRDSGHLSVPGSQLIGSKFALSNIASVYPLDINQDLFTSESP